MTSLHVLSPGTLTTVQDLGRAGHAGLGVAPSGALDPASLRLANRIVGNHEEAPALELTFGGLVLRADGPCVVAVTGAPVTLTVSNEDARTYGCGSAVPVPNGAELSIGPPSGGLRSWLAVRGGLDAPEVLGSASTDLLAGINAPLAEGDVLTVGPPPEEALPSLDGAPLSVPSDDCLTLRVVLGPRHTWFTDDALASLREPWTVDQRSNRVGIRLDGPALERDAEHDGRELPSEGAVAGAVQVASNGLPVLFLADHPVTAGYPVVACVVTEDLPLAAQAVPGQTVRFRPVEGPQLP